MWVCLPVLDLFLVKLWLLLKILSDPRVHSTVKVFFRHTTAMHIQPGRQYHVNWHDAERE